MIKIKRVYEKNDKTDGLRILVDRLWPRGLSKQKAHIDLWLKDIAPSDKLRKLFSHDPSKWLNFKTKYKKELDTNKELLYNIKHMETENKIITLLYSAQDQNHNNAIVLCKVLQKL